MRPTRPTRHASHTLGALQELLEDFRADFRANGIPDDMYNTDHADDTECISWCLTGGQIAPIPNKKGKRKAPAGGMRQRVERLGGLRCVIAEKEAGSDEAPLLLVVMAHGINVLGDDLYGLAYHCGATFGGVGMSRVRFVLPAAPEEVEQPKVSSPWAAAAGARAGATTRHASDANLGTARDDHRRRPPVPARAHTHARTHPPTHPHARTHPRAHTLTALTVRRPFLVRRIRAGGRRRAVRCGLPADGSSGMRA